MNNPWQKINIIKGFLHEALERHPDMTDTIQECAQFIDDQQTLIDNYDEALHEAAVDLHNELLELTPDDVEVALPSEFETEWKAKFNIPMEEE